MGLIGDILFGKEAKFCPECGKHVVLKTGFTEFDKSTGERDEVRWLACPNADGPTPPSEFRGRTDVQRCHPHRRH